MSKTRHIGRQVIRVTEEHNTGEHFNAAENKRSKGKATTLYHGVKMQL